PRHTKIVCLGQRPGAEVHVLKSATLLAEYFGYQPERSEGPAFASATNLVPLWPLHTRGPARLAPKTASKPKCVLVQQKAGSSLRSNDRRMKIVTSGSFSFRYMNTTHFRNDWRATLQAHRIHLRSYSRGQTHNEIFTPSFSGRQRRSRCRRSTVRSHTFTSSASRSRQAATVDC